MLNVALEYRTRDNQTRTLMFRAPLSPLSGSQDHGLFFPDPSRLLRTLDLWSIFVLQQLRRIGHNIPSEHFLSELSQIEEIVIAVSIPHHHLLLFMRRICLFSEATPCSRIDI